MLEKNKEICDISGSEITRIKTGKYTGIEAHLLLVELRLFRGTGMDSLILGALEHSNHNDLEIELLDFRKYNDNSGHYHAIIFHKSFPEGFKMEIENGLDLNIKICQWGYGE